MFGAIGLIGVSSAPSISGHDRIEYQSNGIDYRQDIPGGAEYVALGDSYSASGSKAKRLSLDACARNPDDLGHVVAQELQPATFTDRACAGGTIETLSKPSTRRGGSTAQLDAVGPHTRLVTITVGANSMDFGAVIIHCFKEPNPDECRRMANTNVPGSRLYEAVRRDYRAAVELVRERAADDVRVVLVGYLPIFAESGEIDAHCLAENHISMENVEQWRIFHRALNQLVRDVAADTGADYVAAPSDHPVCSPEPYVAPERANDAAAGIDAYGLHPTVAGQRAVGELIAERVRAGAGTPGNPLPPTLTPGPGLERSAAG